jgi:ribosome recycling factor
MSISVSSKPQFDKVIEHLALELQAVRTGRANPSIVENLQAEAYGVMQPVKALATISTPDSRTIQIEPWDQTAVKAIETAIMKSDIGMAPNVDGKVIRLVVPMMTEEMRKDIVKKMKVRLEDAKVAIRQVREEYKKKIEALESVSKDDIHRDLENLEKIVKEYVGKVDEAGAKKEKEVMSV